MHVPVDRRRHSVRRFSRGLALVAIITCAALLPRAPAQARDFGSDTTRGDQHSVDHDGIYLAQRIGQCMNGTGPCYFGGQCPGGEYATNRYANGRVYCGNFYPPAPYPPTLFERLLTGRR